MILGSWCAAHSYFLLLQVLPKKKVLENVTGQLTHNSPFNIMPFYIVVLICNAVRVLRALGIIWADRSGTLLVEVHPIAFLPKEEKPAQCQCKGDQIQSSDPQAVPQQQSRAKAGRRCQPDSMFALILFCMMKVYPPSVLGILLFIFTSTVYS